MILVEYQEKFFTAPAYELWKESLNRDGYQFHQYQQNEQSSLILIELNEHKKNPGPGLGQAHECGEVKLVKGISTLISGKRDLQRQCIYKFIFISWYGIRELVVSTRIFVIKGCCKHKATESWVPRD
jgi:hypothetical protein